MDSSTNSDFKNAPAAGPNSAFKQHRNTIRRHQIGIALVSNDRRSLRALAQDKSTLVAKGSSMSHVVLGTHYQGSAALNLSYSGPIHS